MVVNPLSDKDPSVRLHALSAAIQSCGSQTETFAYVLQNDKNLKILETCIDAIEELKCLDLVPNLGAFLTNKKQEKNLRARAATALGRIGDQSARPYLVSVLTDKSYAVREDAQSALEMLDKQLEK